MKKLITLSMLFASMLFAGLAVEAKPPVKTSTTISTVQDYRWQNNRRNNYRRGVRVVNRTRIVRQGFRVYRETIQIRYLPNGRTQTKVIRRVRIR